VEAQEELVAVAGQGVPALLPHLLRLVAVVVVALVLLLVVPVVPVVAATKAIAPQAALELLVKVTTVAVAPHLVDPPAKVAAEAAVPDRTGTPLHLILLRVVEVVMAFSPALLAQRFIVAAEAEAVFTRSLLRGMAFTAVGTEEKAQ